MPRGSRSRGLTVADARSTGGLGRDMTARLDTLRGAKGWRHTDGVSQRDRWLRRPTGILDPILRVAVLVSIGCRSRTSSPRLGDCGTHHIHITRATRGRSRALRLAPRWMPTTVNARDIGAPWGPLMLDAAPNRWRMLKHAGRTVLILGALRNAPVRVATLGKRDAHGVSPNYFPRRRGFGATGRDTRQEPPSMRVRLSSRRS